jgi:hypothetical protein
MIKNKGKYISTILFVAALAFTQNVIAQSTTSANGITLPNVGLPSATLPAVVAGLARWLLGIFGFLAIISFIISGTMYFLAMGDEKEMDKAKNQMKWSITGVVVGIMGLVIIMAVDQMMRGGGLF